MIFPRPPHSGQSAACWNAALATGVDKLTRAAAFAAVANLRPRLRARAIAGQAGRGSHHMHGLLAALQDALQRNDDLDLKVRAAGRTAAPAEHTSERVAEVEAQPAE